jgi:hypothetical protein
MLYACKYCGIEFEVKQKLGGHSRVCKLNPRYASNLRQLDEARKNVGKNSKNIVINGESVYFKCELCENTYSTKSGLTLHTWKVHGDGKFFDPNAGYRDGTRQAWNKGKTKSSDERIERASEKISIALSGISRPNTRKERDLKQLNDYRLECSFSFSLQQFPDEFDFSLIEKYGWYSAKNRGNNLGGVSRDHIVSVKFGYDNGIDPKIISHPANCQLLIHNDNVSKNKKCGITLDELINKIKEWDNKYKSSGD